MASAAELDESTLSPMLSQKFKYQGTIGQGSFGVVSKITRRSDGRELVCKAMNYGSMDDRAKQLLVSEVNILREMRHPFIVRYYDRIVDKKATTIFIIMEFCEGGDVGRIINKCKRDSSFLDEAFIWKVFAELVAALKECHRRKDGKELRPVLHRDIKPGNVFLDARGRVKLGDFGLAKQLASQSKFAYTHVGTPFYMSPEMINETKYNEKSDIWALGCLIYEMCALSPPFDASNHLSLAVKINQGKFPRIPDKYSEGLYRAVRWCLQLDSTARPTVEELERLPEMRQPMAEAGLLVREYNSNHAVAVKMHELKGLEAKLKAREQALDKREAELAAREAAVADVENARRGGGSGGVCAPDARRQQAAALRSATGI